MRSPRIRERLISTLLDLIGRERAGEAIDCMLVRSSTQMLSDLGVAVYAEDFERAFLAASAEFYASEAQGALGCCDCPEYLRRAEVRLREEGARCKAYLDASSEAKITAVVEEQLRDAKVVSFKKRRRKNSRRLTGHRQQLTALRVVDITQAPLMVGAPAAAAAAAAA